MGINVLNEDWKVRYEQFQRMAEHDNSEAAGVYRLAMSNWRLNAEVERNNGRPLPPKPVPAKALKAAWPNPQDILPPYLAITVEFVCPEEPGLPDLFPPPPKPNEVGEIADIGAWMGPGSRTYHVGPTDNMPDGTCVILVKHIQTSITGPSAWYERLQT